MRKVAILVFAVLLPGCAVHGNGSSGSGSVSFHLNFNTNRPALIAIGILAIASEHEREQRYVHSNPVTAFDPTAGRAVPQMDASRKVHEQDCSKPIEDGSANLRCR